MATAVSSAGALKQYIESLGLSISAYRDWAPDGATFPYITITEGINLVFDPMETQETEANYRTAVEMVQIDLWTPWRNAGGSLVENKALALSVARKLHDARLPASPQVVYGVSVVGIVRLLDIDIEVKQADGTTFQGIVQYTITANLWRQI
jgi:hypothetical protein